MQWFEYLIIVAIILFVGSVIFIAIRNKIRGKTSCGCGGSCAGCSKCCHAKEDLKKYVESK